MCLDRGIQRSWEKKRRAVTSLCRRAEGSQPFLWCCSTLDLRIVNRWLIAIAILLVLCTYVSCAHGCEYPVSFVARNITPLFGIGALVPVFERKGGVILRPIAVVSIAAICFFALAIAETVEPAFSGTSIQLIFLGLASGFIISRTAPIQISPARCERELK